MARRRVTILDLTTKVYSARTGYARVLNTGFSSIMPQVVGVWAEELGHDVTYVCHTGFEDLDAVMAADTDAVFISAFSRSAQTAYAIANVFRKRGAVTILGGPHARAYPDDAVKYFDYVLGFTDKDTVDDVLRELAPRERIGQWLSAARQPISLAGVAARWKFIEPVIAQTPYIRIVPMIGSLGCPYTCSFCIDAVVRYQPLPFDQLREDLRFLLTKMARPIVGWHDPNFGVRFNDYMDAIEEAVPRRRIRFIAESSLSLLSEPNLKRLKDNGFIAMLPGIESWFDLGFKSKTGQTIGLDKVRQVSDHVNMVLRYIPFVQTNFVHGLDSDAGPEPFELTKRFVDMTPGAYPNFNVLNAFGRSAPLNIELQRAGRVLPFPFFFLDGHHAMNVKPLNYEWREFYKHMADMTRYTFSGARVWRRFAVNHGLTYRMYGLVKGTFSVKQYDHHRRIHELLDSDADMLPYFNGESSKLPSYYVNRIRHALGPLWDALPRGAIRHDPNTYRDDPTRYQTAVTAPGALKTRQTGSAVEAERL